MSTDLSKEPKRLQQLGEVERLCTPQQTTNTAAKLLNLGEGRGGEETRGGENIKVES